MIVPAIFVLQQFVHEHRQKEICNKINKWIEESCDLFWKGEMMRSMFGG
jgi:hypothetical protein